MLTRTLVAKLRFCETAQPISAGFAHISCGETEYVTLRQRMNVVFLLLPFHSKTVKK